MRRRLSTSYRPHRPQQTVLYQVLAEHLTDFLGRVEAAERPVPGFVVKELEGFLRCRVLEHGFARQKCPVCDFERLVGLSCAGRGFCPSCLGRRMNEISLCLTESILPRAPVRQWVLSYPPPLRFHLAYDADLAAAALGIFMDEVFRHYRHLAKRELGLARVADAHPGGVLAIQRCGSALNLNFHPHALVLDGVYVEDEPGGPPRFQALPAPTRVEIDQVAWRVCCRTQKLLAKTGKDPSDGGDASGLEVSPIQETLLADCANASMLGTAMFGPRAGHDLLRLGLAPATANDDHDASRPRPAHGYDLHAGVRVPAHDRKRLFRLCQYVLRPPLAHDRLTRLDDGRIRLRLKRPWRDGTSHLLMEPEDLIARLLPLVPPPRVHQVRYYGVLAPRARLRPFVVPRPEPDPRPQQLHLFGKHSQPPPAPAANDDAPATPCTSPQRVAWARLMRKTLDLDVETCPRCHATMRIVDIVFRPDVIRATLAARAQRNHDTRAHPPTGPPQLALGFEDGHRPTPPDKEVTTPSSLPRRRPPDPHDHAA